MLAWQNVAGKRQLERTPQCGGKTWENDTTNWRSQNKSKLGHYPPLVELVNSITPAIVSNVSKSISKQSAVERILNKRKTAVREKEFGTGATL